MAIDFGEKRTGLAVTDPLQMIANPLDTIDTKSVVDYIKSYCVREEVDQIVVGLPIRMNNELSAVESSIQTFISKLKELMPKIPVIRQDERFTSSMAAQSLIDGGVKKNKRRDKAVLDKVSATLILQAYLENKNRI